jgi:hypothetical protein
LPQTLLSSRQSQSSERAAVEFTPLRIDRVGERHARHPGWRERLARNLGGTPQQRLLPAMGGQTMNEAGSALAPVLVGNVSAASSGRSWSFAAVTGGGAALGALAGLGLALAIGTGGGIALFLAIAMDVALGLALIGGLIGANIAGTD